MSRRLARELALQSLYQLQLNEEVTPAEAIRVAVEEATDSNEGGLDLSGKDIPRAFVQELVEGTVANRAKIDELLMDYLKGWKMDRLSKVDREVLRLAAYEMLYRDDVPPKVAVNEAIELSKHFGTEESGKFVNGVLGKMIRELDQIKANI